MSAAIAARNRAFPPAAAKALAGDLLRRAGLHGAGATCPGALSGRWRA